MAELSGNADRARRRSSVEAFYPLLAWALGSLLLLAWQWHERGLAGTILVFSVSVDGAASFPDQVSAELDGQPFSTGQRVGLGRARLVLTGQDIEPFGTNLFAWYGRNDLGELRLVGSKGMLELHCDPVPKEIEVVGQVTHAKRAGAPVTFARIPVGTYQVTATFAHSWQREDVQVRRNATNRVDITPAFGSLALASDPTNTYFTLACRTMANFSLEGKVPADITQLPAGEYDLSVRWNDASKEQRLQIAKGETNRQRIVFPYGTVGLVTTPPGATVSSGFNTLGKTPQTLVVKPGKYQFRLALDGYRSADVGASVEDKKTLVLSNRLVNARYADAMDAARNERSSAFGSSDRALSRVEEALRIEPGDPEAAALKANIMAALQVREVKTEEERKAAAAQATGQARQAEVEQKKAAQEARKREADATFEKAAGQIPDAGLFPTHVWSLTNRLDQVRGAVSAMLQEKDAPWKLVEQSAPDSKSWLFRGEGRGGLLGTRKKTCAVMVAEMSPGQVYLYAKFWEYAVGEKINFSFSGLTPDSYVPVVAGRYKPGEPGAAAAYLHAVAEDFTRRLAKELR
ncbi:MAG: carboxypeptidase regulatory-like domain-containing protein [Limisphaerales bacterium]